MIHSGVKMHWEIVNGLRQGEFYVWYQPFFMADGITMAGVEALLRWNHPTQEIGPTEFIKAAEQSDAILELGQFALKQACHDAVRWPSLKLAVNVSAAQLLQPCFVDCVRKTVEESELPSPPP
jgi:EAL domain-containing protein (putative c-di-GMP-specific phosphodiesterase class I)